MKICLWSDGTWCEPRYLDEYQHLSDDYLSITIPEDILEENIDDYLLENYAIHYRRYNWTN